VLPPSAGAVGAVLPDVPEGFLLPDLDVLFVVPEEPGAWNVAFVFLPEFVPDDPGPE
jgi:hypothetical protein